MLTRRPIVVRCIGLVCTLAMLVTLGYRQVNDPRNKIGITERWEWDGQVIGTLLKDAFGKERPLIAVTASGSIPYWSDLNAIDMYGLNDYYCHAIRSGFRHGFPGHELGDGRYILSRRPDLILFHIWGFDRPGCVNGRQMLAARTSTRTTPSRLSRERGPFAFGRGSLSARRASASASSEPAAGGCPRLPDERQSLHRRPSRRHGPGRHRINPACPRVSSI